jgi:hypothetical protein
LNLTNKITNDDISDMTSIAYTKLDLAGSITDTEIANGAGITYAKLNLIQSITDSDISDGAAITYSKLDLTHSIQETDLAPGVLASTITTGDIENGSVTYEKLNLASNEIPYTTLNLSNKITNDDISDMTSIAYTKLDLAGSITDAEIAYGAGIIYTKLNLSNAINSTDIKNSSLNLNNLSTNTFSADTLYITDTTIYGLADIYSDLNVSGNANIAGILTSDILAINQHISYSEAGYDSKLIFESPSSPQSITIPDMSGKLVVISEDGLNGQSLVADGAGGYSWQTIASSGGAITVTDIEDGAITYAKLNLADYIIPYTKVDLNNAIDSNDIKDSTLNLNNLTTTGTLQANTLLVTDTTIIEGNTTINSNLHTTGTLQANALLVTDTTIIEGDTTINNHLSVTGTTYANALSITDTATINGATTINDNLAVTGTTIIDGQTDIHNDVNVSGNAFIAGTVTSSALALSQYIIFTDGLYENKLVLESLSGWNSLTIPDMTGKLVAVQSDGTNGQALVADGLGSYTWQTLETSSDVNYTSVTASKANFDNLTVNNAFVLYNSENPAGQILMSTSAALPQHITIPDISGTVVVTKEQGTNGQAIVADGSGGYTWQTLDSGLTHEITVGEGGDYSTITDALNSITDNSASNQYVIKIGPGTYEEQVTMKEYVDIYGSGKNSTIIVSSGSSADPISGDTSSATVIGANYASIRNLSIQSNSSSDYAIGICNYYVSPTIEDINIYASSSDSNSHAIGIYQYSGSTAISSVEISSVSSGTIHGIYFNNVTEKTIVKQSLIRISGGNYSSGILNENNSKTNIQYVNIIVSSAANGHTGIRNSHSRPTINHVAINLLDDSGNNTDNYAILNENSDPIINNIIGNVFVLTTGPNYGLFNYDSSEPELNNVTLNVKNGATNTKIFNEDSASRIILNATTYTGSLTADSAELTQITIKSNAYLLTSMTFQGYSSTDGIETIIKVTEPTQVNTIRFPDASGTVMLSGGSGGTLDVSSVTANSGTYTEMTVSNQISVSKTTISGDMMLADEYSPISGNTTPADTAFYFGDKNTDGAWRMVRIGTSLVMQRRETGTWVNKMSVNP